MRVSMRRWMRWCVCVETTALRSLLREVERHRVSVRRLQRIVDRLRPLRFIRTINVGWPEHHNGTESALQNGVCL